jgi:hypothetical protein
MQPSSYRAVNMKMRDVFENVLQIDGVELLTAVVIKSSAFWDITPFSKHEPTFRMNVWPPSSRSKDMPSKKPA